MSQLLNLPLLEGNKFIVIDEDVDTSYAKNLIIAWLLQIRKKGVDTSVKVLLFSNPKKYFDKIFKPSYLSNLEVLDYFSVDSTNDDLYEKLMHFLQQNITSILIIDCLSTLALQIGVAKACKFVEKLNQIHSSQILCIYRKNFCINIPRITALGNVYINLKRSNKVAFHCNVHYEASIIHRKLGGSIVKWNELVQQNVENFSLVSEKMIDTAELKKEVNKHPESSVKPQASFRIETNEVEIRQRDNVSLPYILPGNPGGQSKIIYVPDDVDDIDEEDPDEDLDI